MMQPTCARAVFVMVKCCGYIALQGGIQVPIGRVYTVCVDMTLLDYGESADRERSMGNRCCLSHFKTPASAPGLRMLIWIFKREVIWIVLVSNVMTADFFRFVFCPADRTERHVGCFRSLRWKTGLSFVHSAVAAVCGLIAERCIAKAANSLRCVTFFFFLLRLE